MRCGLCRRTLANGLHPNIRKGLAAALVYPDTAVTHSRRVLALDSLGLLRMLFRDGPNGERLKPQEQGEQ